MAHPEVGSEPATITLNDDLRAIPAGLGLLNSLAIRTIKHRLSVPEFVDAGVGTASDACLTMERDVSGILMLLS